MASPLDLLSAPVRLPGDLRRIAEALTGLPGLLQGVAADLRALRVALTPLPDEVRGLRDDLSSLPEGVDRLDGDLHGLQDALLGRLGDVASIIEAIGRDVQPMDSDLSKVEDAVTAMGPRLHEVVEQLDLLRNDLSGLPFVQKS